MDGFGKAKFGNDGNFTKFFKLKEGDNVYRIIPPIKSCAPSGTWAVFHAVHYGYAGIDRKDNSKTRQRPFECVEVKDFRSGMIKQVCVECEDIKSWNAKKQQIIADGTKEGRSKEEIETQLEPVASYLKSHNADKKFYINVMNTAGELGVLLLSYTTKKKKLDVRIKELQKDEPDLDVTDPAEGIWLNFHREGKMLDAEDSVDPVYDIVQLPGGGRARMIKKAPLTPEQCKQALECPDLNDLTTRITPEQVKMLFECGRDPEDIDRIFALSAPRREESPAARVATAATAATYSVTLPPSATMTATAAAVAAGKVAPLAQQPSRPVSPAVAAAAVPTAIDAEEAAALAALEAVRAKRAAAVSPPPVNATAAAPSIPPGVDPLKMSNEEFKNFFPPPSVAQ